jgi:hypothetical protein
MNLLEFLSALGGAIGELEDLSMIARDYATRPWNVSRITLGEDQFDASILGGGDEVMGIARGDFVGIFKPPIGKALFDHVLWVRQALVREAVGRCSLIVGRVAREGALVWVMAGFCSENFDFLVARVWQDGKKLGVVKADGKLHGHHPWLLAQARPPVPYLEGFSVHGVGTFSGTLADFTFSEDPSRAWEFAAISFLAAAVFPYVGSLGCHVQLCEYALLGGPAGVVLTVIGMERALQWQTREKHGLEVFDFLPAGRTSPSWSFALCRRHSSELWSAYQKLVKWREGR